MDIDRPTSGGRRIGASALVSRAAVDEEEEGIAPPEGPRCLHCADSLVIVHARRIEDEALVEVLLCRSGCCQRCGRDARRPPWQCEECEP